MSEVRSHTTWENLAGTTIPRARPDRL